MLKRLIKFSIFLPLTCFCQTIVAQTISEKVDSYVEHTLSEKHIPGLSLAVIRDGIPVKLKGYGFADIENKIAVNPETIFQSGSIGKQFTATAILQLKEEGKLELDDKISKYFPGSPESWKNITIRNLLTHTSGIPDYETANLLDLRKDYTEQELLQFAMKLPVNFPPNEEWAYSNTAYVLLGILIHHLTGKFYGEILKERIFTPLSMETIRVINESDIILNRASGYVLQNGEWKNQSWVSPSLNTTADGSLYLSILDLLKWDAAISTGKLLTPADFNSMFTPVKLTDSSSYPYGFAWFLKSLNGHKNYQHAGSWQGFNSYITKFPDDNLTVIVLTNLSPANPGLIANEIAALYVPELTRIKAAVISDEYPEITKLITQLFNYPDNTKSNNPIISNQFVRHMNELTTTNNSLLNTYGEVQKVEPVKSDNSNQIKYLIKYKVGTRLAVVTIDPSKKITDIVSEAY